MFSHTIKGQKYNMPLLGRFLDPPADAVKQGLPAVTLRPRLIDFELLKGEDGKRTVGFGWFAGGKYHIQTLFRLKADLFLSGGRSRGVFSNGAVSSRKGHRQSFLGMSSL